MATEATVSEHEPRHLTVLHFNDVYEVEERTQEPVGGASRFISLLHRYDADQPLILFSGDVFSPSMLSTVTRGKHMVPLLNLMGISCALYGNHDFDFGLPHLEKLKDRCTFPWLMSNAWDRTTEVENPLGDGNEWLILDWHGVLVGLIGLIEWEWLETLATISVDHVRYESFVECGRRLANFLREEHKVDIVIALSHMRQPNDRILAQEVPEIDLILGGHDHDYYTARLGRTQIVKSGCDFRDLSRISIALPPKGQKFMRDGPAQSWPPLDLTIERLAVTSDIPEDEAAKEIVNSYAEQQQKQLDKVVCRLHQPLDCRFAMIRMQETNVANWIADIMRASLETTDVALLNSGSLRADAILPAGDFRMRDLIKLLPMHDDLVVLSLSGEHLLQALENGVSQYPKHEGRFPCVSGVRFSFDPTQPGGRRIPISSITINNAPIDLTAKYRVITKAYLAAGKDGYSSLSHGEVVVPSENLLVLPNLVQSHLTMVNVAKHFVTADMFTKHATSRFLHKRRSSVAIHPNSKKSAQEESKPEGGGDAFLQAMNNVTPKKSQWATLSRSPIQRGLSITAPNTPSLASRDSPSKRKVIDNDHLEDLLTIHAVVDGRITLITSIDK